MGWATKYVYYINWRFSMYKIYQIIVFPSEHRSAWGWTCSVTRMMQQIYPTYFWLAMIPMIPMVISETPVLYRFIGYYIYPYVFFSHPYVYLQDHSLCWSNPQLPCWNRQFCELNPSVCWLNPQLSCCKPPRKSQVLLVKGKFHICFRWILQFLLAKS